MLKLGYIMAQNNRKIVLVTGGAGFIGAHTVKKLASLGYKVIVADSLNKYYDAKLKADRLKVLLKGVKFSFYKIDITNFKALRKIFQKHHVDIICHLAGQPGVRYSLENPFAYGEANVMGTLNLLELAREFKVKSFIFASSSSVYGDTGKMPFVEEQKADSPVSIYAATKKSSELLAFTYHHLYGINCTGLRFFTVYGPWGRPDMALFGFTNKILNHKPIDIYNYGNMQRDFTYIDDIVAGVVAAIKKNFPWEIINLCSSRPVKLLKFVEIIEKELGVKANKKFLPMQKGDVVNTFGSAKKAKKLLGYKPKATIERGIKSFVGWYRNYYKV